MIGRKNRTFSGTSCFKKSNNLNKLESGGGEIRTHGRVSPTTIFKTVAFNRSATPPERPLAKTVPIQEMRLILIGEHY